MLNWKSLDITYLYDGSFDGLLTIIFDCFAKKVLPYKICASSVYQTNLIDHFIYVQTDLEKSKRIIDGILNFISYHVLYNSYSAFLSNSNTKEINIFKYICHSFIDGPRVDNMLSIDYVFEVNRLRKKVFIESHRLKGLIRFIHITDDNYYAIIHPDHDVIEIVGKHFIRRLPNQNFFIIDKIRNKAFVYHKKDYRVLDVTNLEIPDISEEEKLYQDLWKAFFKTIAIKERTNPKLQASYMPKRYWQDLIEMD